MFDLNAKKNPFHLSKFRWKHHKVVQNHSSHLKQIFETQFQSQNTQPITKINLIYQRIKSKLTWADDTARGNVASSNPLELLLPLSELSSSESEAWKDELIDPGLGSLSLNLGKSRRILVGSKNYVLWCIFGRLLSYCHLFTCRWTLVHFVRRFRFSFRWRVRFDHFVQAVLSLSIFFLVFWVSILWWVYFKRVCRLFLDVYYDCLRRI